MSLYVEAAAERSEAARLERNAQLTEDASGINRACEQLHQIANLQAPRTVNVRLGFVGPLSSEAVVSESRTPYRPELAFERTSTPPATSKLLSRRGESLRLELLLLAIAHCLIPPGGRPTSMESRLEDAYCDLRTLAGMADLRARRAMLRLQRAKRGLEEESLLVIGRHRSTTSHRPGSSRHYRSFRMLNEGDNSSTAYVVPGAQNADPSQRPVPKGTLGIPLSFFLSGWHLVLSPTEIAVYLMLRHAQTISLLDPYNAAVFRRGGATMIRPIQIYRETRLEQYGISDDAYTAHRSLAEFGLIYRGQKASAGTRGRSGSRISGHRFILRDDTLSERAVDVVSRALRSGPAPHLRKIDETTDFTLEPRHLSREPPRSYKSYPPYDPAKESAYYDESDREYFEDDREAEDAWNRPDDEVHALDDYLRSVIREERALAEEEDERLR